MVQAETCNGLMGLGEVGGGAESVEAVSGAMKQYLAGRDPGRIEEMRSRIPRDWPARPFCSPPMPLVSLLAQCPAVDGGHLVSGVSS